MGLPTAEGVVELGDMTEVHITPQLLKEIRAKLGITQTEAGKRCRVGLRAWQRWEAGDTRPEGPATIAVELLLAEANTKTVMA